MLSALFNSTALLIVFPLFVFFLITLLGQKIFKRPKASMQMAADFSTFFFILAVCLFAHLLFGKSILLYMLLLLFLLGITVVLFYAKKHGEINFIKVLRIYWRLCFVLVVLCYIVLFVIGVVLSLMQLIK
ncbi:DUF3397 domain-containing protein [Listeria sp. PSOL-1]|uniref:DUF3397 domain-containing protein n=1 Tax=Listeria sp. PSOL-1 TaxID=1844999 RepID=UPI0013D5C72C|nr:DUF3397 domain-containing protein [Listeria sp. PSOL-1]